jgi:hypothetical protein
MHRPAPRPSKRPNNCLLRCVGDLEADALRISDLALFFARSWFVYSSLGRRQNFFSLVSTEVKFSCGRRLQGYCNPEQGASGAITRLRFPEVMGRPVWWKVVLLGLLAVFVAIQVVLQRGVIRVLRPVTRDTVTLPRTFLFGKLVQESNMFRPKWNEEGMAREEINFKRYEGILLTLVMATRNDGYGGNSSLTRISTTLRMINYFAGKYGVALEVLFVEWNPPDDRPAVWTTLPWMPNVAVVRVVTVPRWVHEAWSQPHVAVRNDQC